jgi:hypothetical protein
MATQRQIEANRRNAQKCTGPRTPEGKARSSRNALKTGIDAKSAVLPSESAAKLDELTAAYHARFTPATGEELNLVDTLIRSEWLQRRYLRSEASIWQDHLGGPDASLGAAFFAASATLCRVSRRQNTAHRDYRRALRQLLNIRQYRPATPAPIRLPAESNVATEQLNRELVSFLISTNPPPPPHSNNPPSHPAQSDII